MTLPVHLHHLTLNTGHLHVSGPGDVDMRAVLPALMDLVNAGGGVVPHAGGLRLELATTALGGSIFTLYYGTWIVAANGLAWDRDGASIVWNAIESTYLQLTDHHPSILALGAEAPAMPAALPWLSTLILPSIALVPRETLGLLGDLERCVACCILHTHGIA